ncbi:secreted/periplasmic Zn-dependent peptidase, insulinase-like protein [Nitzschia inconspicua]|uniref:Secreted/periplasmic Zn-dependent peptidase, insulinase-like protein n=1 Tax=Nitzschia inconspicua TaxID=303405 RepID=A0A9K3PYT2_9STRA|nr:secreted/periplasmic Zn-dependent peptidase, insulinase-like protein [Nitzschia inconspicua]
MMYSRTTATTLLAQLVLCISAGQSFVARRLFSKQYSSSPASVLSSSIHPPFFSSTLFASSLVTAENSTSPSISTLTSSFSTSPGSTTSTTTILADASDFIKPDRDLREYRYIRLPNNLQALLVSTAKAASEEVHGDKEEELNDDYDDEDDDSSAAAAQVEAAAVHVQAGHFDDTIPGLAHFNEHMLFLGTEKYPSEDEYEGFLSKYGGLCNAYTDMEDTNYYLSVTTQQSDPNTTSDGLRGALDRLAQFFIAPKFEENMVERELRAIDSEYRNGKTSDVWRNYQFLKAISNPNHPFSNFGCGNYETLSSKGSPVGELKKFWETYYTTSNMRLAVVGSSSLDALQKTVEDTFGQIPYSNQPPRREKVNPLSPVFPRENAVYDHQNPAFGPEQLGKLREVIPLMETRSVKIHFLAPPLEDPVLRKSKPQRVISHLLGHESPGSLHYVLNEKGYLTGLTSGSALDVSDFSLFSLTLSLTPKGMKARDEVIDLVFQWIALIKKMALEDPVLVSKYHDELRQMAATNFKFRENGDPTDFCSSAAELLFEDTPPNELLVSGSQCEDYDPVVGGAFLDRLRPDNCMINIFDSGLTQDQPDEWQIEPLYGAVYREQDFSADQLKRWGNPEEIDAELHIPGLNEYIPTDFSLRCDDLGEVLSERERENTRYEPPSLIQMSDNFRMWHKMDRSWRVPKTFIRLSLVSSKTYETPRAMTLSRIYQRVLNDDLNSFVYDASLAGCSYSISCAPTGYKVSVRGYSEKLPILVDTLTTRMLSLIEELKEGKDKHPALFDRFQKAKDNLLRETKNYRLDTPYEVANYNSRLLMEENVWYLDDYIDEMEGENAERFPLTMEECAKEAESCLSGNMKADALCIGNIDEKAAMEVADVVNRHFMDRSRPLNDAQTPSFKSMKMPTNAEAQVIFGPEVSDESIPIKYQELAFSPSEENNAVEVTLQVGSDLSLGYEGIGILDLIGHLGYSSAYNQLRTREQLGYIVSVYTRKTAGSVWGLTIVVQSSSKSPEYLEQRIEEWLKLFRKELEEMAPEEMAMEARAVVVQLLEEDTKLSQEVGTWWNEIVATQTNHERMTTPSFDRLERLADELNPTMEGLPEVTKNGTKRKSPQELKERLLSIFDNFCAQGAEQRRALSSRVFSQAAKAEYEESQKQPGVLSSYSDMRFLKEFLSTWPVAPYWRIVKD